ncbi:respiratory nitrate reductase subunit gamma [Nocardia altamirensis]|uniref:respiratory nitrate reductase subunit gamma n=1 Tax=Nocardia altamirensis TaxID=472158 RepID=UPI0008402E9E|nr:respiratory nitrate reductase subunit gamma [Nocardia altamirensis]
MMSLLWIILPYSAFLSFAAGHVWRYRHDRFSWYITGPDVDRAQRIGAPALRIGIGMLVVVRLTDLFFTGPHNHPDGPLDIALAVIEVCALVAGSVGAVLLFVPDMIGTPARQAVTPLDRLTFPLMVAALLSWVAVKFDPNSSADANLTTETLFTWFRSLFTLHPNPEAMANAPLIYQARGLAVLSFLAIWPYTRLAGIFADPVIRFILRIRPELAASRTRLRAAGQQT